MQPEVVEAIKAGKSVEDFAFDDASGQPLGVDASDAEEDGTEDLDELISEAAPAEDEGHKEDLELDSIFNMISKEASPEKK